MFLKSTHYASKKRGQIENGLERGYIKSHWLNTVKNN